MENTQLEKSTKISRSKSGKKRRTAVTAEKIEWTNQAVFILLLIMPILTVIAYGGVDVWMVGLNSVLTCLLVLFWVIDVWKSRKLQISSNYMQLPLIGLIIIGLIQLLPLRSTGVVDGLLGIASVSSLSLNPYLTRLFVIQLVIALIFFAAALAFVNNRSRYQTMIMSIIVFGSLMSFFGVLQHLSDAQSVFGMRAARQSLIFGTFFNQHHFAAFMEMTLGLTLGLLFAESTHKNLKIFLVGGTIVMGMALFLTGSRGGIVSFLGVLGFVVLVNFFNNRKIKNNNANEEIKNYFLRRNLILFGGGFAIILLLFFSVIFVGGDESLLRGFGISGVEGDVSTGRTHFWQVALQIFLAHPIIGSGFDSFGVAFPLYDSWSGVYRVEQAHNDYLQILSDSGIVGFVCILFFIFFLFKSGIRTLNKNSEKFIRNAVIGAMAGCFGILIHSFFDFPLRTPSNSFYFLMLAAIIAVPVNFSIRVRKVNKLVINKDKTTEAFPGIES